jgi:site-specific DNA-methyltransferase (adenine-specific)
MIEINKIHQGDCLELMKDIPDKSTDMILCDLPYGTTACKWDTIIPFEPLWEQYKRIIKDNGAIVLTASQPFTSALVMSNIKMFKYEWIWRKTKANGFMNVKKMPLKDIENICVFYRKNPTYNPQGLINFNKTIKNSKSKTINDDYISGQNGGAIKKSHYIQKFTNYPRQVLDFGIEPKPLHPTQKPVALFEYLIKTYTNEGDLVLDNCIGSGTTAIACINTHRKFIGIELIPEYCKIAIKRIEEKQ